MNQNCWLLMHENMVALADIQSDENKPNHGHIHHVHAHGNQCTIMTGTKLYTKATLLLELLICLFFSLVVEVEEIYSSINRKTDLTRYHKPSLRVKHSDEQQAAQLVWSKQKKELANGLSVALHPQKP